jgi:hypothetical protein
LDRFSIFLQMSHFYYAPILTCVTVVGTGRPDFMALTLGHHVFAAVHQDAVNKLLKAYRAARPKYFFYACPPLGSGTPSVDFWILPPLPVPGTNSGIPFSVKIRSVRIDFTPEDAGLTLPSPLTLGANQFAILLEIEVCFMCGLLIAIDVPRESADAKEGRRPNSRHSDGKPHTDCAKLSIWAVGHPFSVANIHGGRDVGLQVDGIVVKEVGALEPLFECYFETMLDSLLDAMRFPVEQFALGAFGSLALANGPLIAEDQLKVWADIL